MDRASLAFCVFAVALSLGASAVGFHLAAMPVERVVAARTPTPAERLPDLDLGPGFGKISVLDLVGYYLERPPVAAAGTAAPAAARRFSGC